MSETYLNFFNLFTFHRDPEFGPKSRPRKALRRQGLFELYRIGQRYPLCVIKSQTALMLGAPSISERALRQPTAAKWSAHKTRRTQILKGSTTINANGSTTTSFDIQVDWIDLELFFESEDDFAWFRMMGLI